MADKKPDPKPWTKFEKISFVLIVVIGIVTFPLWVVIGKGILGTLIASAIFYPLLLLIYIPIIYIACRKKLRNKTKKAFINLLRKLYKIISQVFKKSFLKSLLLPKNKFGRFVVNVLFIPFWFYIYGQFFVETIEDLFDIYQDHFLIYAFFLIPIFFYTRYLWFEKSRSRIFFGIFDKLKFNLKQFNTDVFNTTSDADELKKYADLRDQGIITEDEFKAKKNKLLDL